MNNPDWHEPYIKVEKTGIAPDGAWIASGTVTFKVLRDGVTHAHLTFPFGEARDQRTALRQAAHQLQQVSEVFLRYSKTLENQ